MITNLIKHVQELQIEDCSFNLTTFSFRVR